MKKPRRGCWWGGLDETRFGILMIIPRYSLFRSKANWGAALMVELMSPLLRAYSRRQCGGELRVPRKWDRALVVGANHIGDILYRTGSLDALKKGLPGCELYYLAAPKEAGLLERNPALTRVLPWARTDQAGDLARAHMEELRRLRFDALLATSTGRYWPELRLALRLGIPNRVGYIHKGFSGWVTHPIPIQYPQSYPHYFRDYVSHLTGLPPDWSVGPKMYPDTDSQAQADAIFTSLNGIAGEPVLACFLTTRQGLRNLPIEMLGRTLQTVREKRRIRIVLLGTADDEAMLITVDRQYDLQANVLAGKLTLSALYCFLKRCQGVVTADSGPRHLANAAEVPVCFFRNLNSHPVETGAYLNTETDLCPPGVNGLSEEEHRRVLSEIDPVISAGRILFALESASSRKA